MNITRKKWSFDFIFTWFTNVLQKIDNLFFWDFMNILAILVKAINVLRWQSYKKYDEWDRKYFV